MELDAMTLVFRMLSFNPDFSVSSFIFIKRLFSSSLLSAIRVVSSAYLRLLIFLLAILIPAYASYSPPFCMMSSACKLNKKGDSIQPWRTPFLIWNQSIASCPVLTVASWPVYRFLRKQVMSDDFSDGRLGCEHPEEQEQILLISVFLNTWQGLYVLQISTK